MDISWDLFIRESHESLVISKRQRGKLWVVLLWDCWTILSFSLFSMCMLSPPSLPLLGRRETPRFSRVTHARKINSGLRQLCCYDNETGGSLRNNMAAEKRTISAIGLLKDVEFHMVKAAAEVSLVSWAANMEKLFLEFLICSFLLFCSSKDNFTEGSRRF